MVVVAGATPTVKQKLDLLGLTQTLIVSLVVTNYVRITPAQHVQKQRFILATKRTQPGQFPWAAV